MASKVILALLVSAHFKDVAAQLYFTASSTLIPSSSSQIWTLPENGDLEKLEMVLDLPAPDEELGALSGAVVCGDIYYAVWTDIPLYYGVFGMNITSGELLFKDQTDLLFHTMDCAPGGVVAAATSTAGNGGMYLASYNASSKATKIISEFPSDLIFGGFDNAFVFSEDGSELWSALPQERGNPVLTIMSTSTGDITGQRNFPSSFEGTPYVVLPGPFPGDTQGSAFIDNLNNVPFLRWSEFAIPENPAADIVITPGDDVYADMYSSSQPWAHCGGIVYSFFEGEVVDDFFDKARLSGISAVDSSDGTLLWKATLPTLDDKIWGALACA